LKRDFKAVLFDLDETLTDSSDGLEAAHRAVTERLHNYLRQHGVEVNETTLRSKLNTLEDKMNIETKYDRDKWWPELLPAFGLKQKLPRQIAEELTQLYWTNYSNADYPYADAESTLSYLKQKGYKLGLITDTDGKPGIKNRRLARFDFIRLFDVVVISGEDTLRTKPSPEPFLFAASELGLPASKCIFVGDKPFTDIKGAKAAGMRTVLVKRRDWGIGERADFTVSSLSEIPLIIEKNRKSYNKNTLS